MTPATLKTLHKPIYLLLAEDKTEKAGISYYIVNSSVEGSAVIDIKGYEINKTQAEKFRKDPYGMKETLEKAKDAVNTINRKIPWNNVIRMENLNHNKPQGEK